MIHKTAGYSQTLQSPWDQDDTGKKKKDFMYLYSMLRIPLWCLPFPTGTNTGMETLHKRKICRLKFPQAKVYITILK